MADVGELAPRRTDLSAMSFQTSAWSEKCAPRSCMHAVTCDMRFARPVAYCARGAEANVFDRARHRPASTHDTGIVRSECAGTMIVRLTTRFCFAPTSSSPSTMRIGLGPRFTTRSSGTLPCSEISVISTAPDAKRIVQDIVDSAAVRRAGPQQRQHRQVFKRQLRANSDRRQRGGEAIVGHGPSLRPVRDRCGHGNHTGEREKGITQENGEGRLSGGITQEKWRTGGPL